MLDFTIQCQRIVLDMTVFFFKAGLLQYNLHTVNLASSVVPPGNSESCMQSCNHFHNQDIEQFHHPVSPLYAFVVNPLHPFPTPGNPDLFAGFIVLLFSMFSLRNNCLPFSQKKTSVPSFGGMSQVVVICFKPVYFGINFANGKLETWTKCYLHIGLMDLILSKFGPMWLKSLVTVYIINYLKLKYKAV